jgi:NADPH:quinone reductase-like Zn-dependent oxidoreductase
MMKALRLHKRGGPEQIVYEDAPKPMIRSSDALIRVIATGITPAELGWDPTYKTKEGADRLPIIPTHELCGVVTEIGEDVRGLRVGQEVYGLTSFWRDGCAAEYVAVEADGLAPKPQSLDAIKSAALPLSALTAWQAFFEHANLLSGQRVLIHGAAGGVGAFAVQIARWAGAHVIATASAQNVAFVKELGAHEVIDYTKVHFEEAMGPVDLVLDTIGGGTRHHSWHVLKMTGLLISLAGPVSEEELVKTRRRGLFFIVSPNREQLIEIARLADTGVITPTIAKVFPLEKGREAFEYALSGHMRGKVILQVSKN